MKNIVFISYAREDKRIAERLYMDLRRNNLNAWLDTKCLLPGQNWRNEIETVINECAFFILLISNFSTNKRGFVQKEIKTAFNVLEEVPSNKIFLIPVKLDKTKPHDRELLNLNWVNLYESYDSGLKRILSVISEVKKDPLLFYDTEHPYGQRAPINYTPFSSFDEFVLDLISKFPISTSFFDDNIHSVYISFYTDHEGVVMPEYLKKDYPHEIKIVLQHQFKDLDIGAKSFQVKLWFNKLEETLRIQYSSIFKIEMPAINLEISRT